jgi:hypothetical protein
MMQVLAALRDTLPANPWPAILWFAAALGLACLIVYVWRRAAGL